jgi:hypothetical protein
MGIIKNSRAETHVTGRVAGDSGVNRQRKREQLRKANLDLELPRGGPAYKYLFFRRSPQRNRCATRRNEQPNDAS